MTLFAGINYKCEYCGNPMPNVSIIHERKSKTGMASQVFGTSAEIGAEQTSVCSGPVKIYCSLCGKEYQEMAHVLQISPEHKEEFIRGIFQRIKYGDGVKDSLNEKGINEVYDLINGFSSLNMLEIGRIRRRKQIHILFQRNGTKYYISCEQKKGKNPDIVALSVRGVME